MRRTLRSLTRVGALVSGAAVLAGATAVAVTTLHAGPQPDGTGVTTAGWRLTPAGHQMPLGDLPTALAVSHDGSHMLVLNTGQGTQSLQVVDEEGDLHQTIEYKSPEALYAGVAWSPDDRRVYASAGGNNKIRVYDVAGGTLTEGAPIAIPASAAMANPYPAGLAVAPEGKHLFVADQLGDAMSAVDLASGAVTTVEVGHNPYAVALSPDGGTAYVSNQGGQTVSVLDVRGATPVVVRTVAVGTHPNRMVVDPSNGTLYVANGDSDSVSVVRAGASAPSRTIDLAPYEGAPVGSNPDGLALSKDGRTLYVANSGNNDLAVVDLGKQRVAGMVPTAWYPTDVALSSEGRQLFIASGKGLGAGPNDGPGHPNPEAGGQSPSQYVGSMMVGTLSTVDVPDSRQLARYSQQVVRNNGFDERDKSHPGDGSNQVVPIRPTERSPIEHVIYVVKENRTFDQEFGSLGKGNGDPSLNLFGDESAPNSRALQRQFVTLDNFYANAEISAQGWNWSTGANSNPYVEQTWPANYSGRNRPYDFEGGNAATAPNRDPSDAYLWDRLADAGVSFRNYGFFKSGHDFNAGFSTPDPRLVANDDAAFWGYDLHCPDSSGTFTPLGPCGAPRVDEWLREFTEHVANRNLPAVELVRLPNDHTAGTQPGSPTPKAYVADNDYALGRLVDAVSHSPYWSSTAIFVVEDDAQNGPDHVDAHRTIAQVISPYTRTGKVDPTFYSTVSMLRTMELIVGLHPMTQFDAAATPMLGAFTTHPDTAPFVATKPADEVLKAVNGPRAASAGGAVSQDLSQEDRIDEQSFNREIWQSVKGPGVPMPEPQHHVIRAGPAAGDGD